MKKINLIKIILDVLMAVVFVLLFNKSAVAGMAFHEIAGLSIGVAFIIHIVLNLKWVKQVTLNLFSKKINFKTRLGYILDVLLLLSFAFIIISGILISKVVFPNLRISSSIPFERLHISVSYFALLLVGIHIGLHWKWAMNMFKKMFKIPEKKKTLQALSIVLVVAAFIFGSYNLYSTNYLSKLSFIGTTSNGKQFSGERGGNNMKGSFENGDNNFHNDNQSGNTSENGTGRPARGDFSPNMKGGPGASGSSTLKTVVNNLSIISVFAAITYYIEKLLALRAAKKA